MKNPSRVLVVTAEPDERFSTGALRRIVQELDRRAQVEATTFFLRAENAPADDWGRFRVVDDLRTHPVSRSLALLGTRPSGWFNGWKLRRWLAQVNPDVVILDDGLGERVVRSISPQPLIVIRPNEELPASAELEPPPLRKADLVLRAAGADDDEAPDSLESGHLVDARRLATLAATARTSTRQRWSIPPDELLLIGWGPDPWLDGTGLFVRTLWYLQHHHETATHGLWLGLEPTGEAFAELQMEVERCGLTEQMHFQELDDDPTRWSGDAVFLPHRTELDQSQMVDVVAAGNPVVSFAPAVLDDPAFLTVAPLDLDAAAGKLAVVLREGPASRLDRTMRLDVARWASSFIEAIDDREARTG